MKKSLLLTVCFTAFALKIFASTTITDSTIAPAIVADSAVLIKGNPRAGFKNLFDAASLAPGISTSHLNAQALSFVKDYIDRYGIRLNKMKSWGKPYFDMMDHILALHGLPSELKYLSVIESDLQSSAVSWAGAVGPWQFMPATGRRLGLRINQYTDERTDFYKSTHAAARYLADLYNTYGDWLLVIAAYNGGPGNVNTAIRKSGSRNFWNLQYYLPEESRNHVKKFIATHYIMEGQGGITTLTKSETNGLVPDKYDTTDLNITIVQLNGGSKYHSEAIANYTKMDITTFNRLNPNFDQLLAGTDAGKTLPLRLPADKVALFEANKTQILEQSLRLMLAM